MHIFIKTGCNGERPFPPFKINVLLVFKRKMSNEQVNRVDAYSIVIQPTLSTNYMSHIGLHRSESMRGTNSLIGIMCNTAVYRGT